MADFSKAFSVGGALALGPTDNIGILHGADDPSIVGQDAPIGSFLLQDNGVSWRKIGPGSTDWSITFGLEHQWVFSPFISTTTSNTFQTKTTLTTTSLIGGTYRLEVSYGWFLDSISDDFEGRVLQDGVPLGELHKQEPKDNFDNNQRMYICRKEFIDITPGIHTYTLQFRTDGGTNDPASIFEASIELWRVA